MTPERIEKLDSLGFEWNTHQCHFDHAVRLLRKYIEVHGQKRIPENHVVEGINLELGGDPEKGVPKTPKRPADTNDVGKVFKAESDWP